MIWVIPCYNEAERLDIPEFTAFSSTSQLLFVDDGSSDDTLAVLEQLASPQTQVLALPRNQGKAEAVRQGLLHAISRGASVVGFADADLATSPKELVRLEHILVTSTAAVVMGARVARAGAQVQRGMWRHYAGRSFATAASLVLGQHFYDTQCGAKLFHVTSTLQAVLAEPFLSRWVFDVELIGRLLISGLSYQDFLEVPLDSWTDQPGTRL